MLTPDMHTQAVIDRAEMIACETRAIERSNFAEDAGTQARISIDAGNADRAAFYARIAAHEAIATVSEWRYYNILRARVQHSISLQKYAAARREATRDPYRVICPRGHEYTDTQSPDRCGVCGERRIAVTPQE